MKKGMSAAHAAGNEAAASRERKKVSDPAGRPEDRRQNAEPSVFDLDIASLNRAVNEFIKKGYSWPVFQPGYGPI